jgi:hypothetical protein
MGGSARSKAVTYTNRINTDIHALSGIRTHDPSVRAALDRADTMTGLQTYDGMQFLIIFIQNMKIKNPRWRGIICFNTTNELKAN